MSIRLFKTTHTENGYPTVVKEISFAFLDGTLIGRQELADRPIEVRVFKDRLDCEVADLHGSSYSRRALNAEVGDLLKTMGPQAFDALSATKDLEDSACFVWDDRSPTQLNPTTTPLVENGAPLPVSAGTGEPDPSDDDDDDDDDGI